MRRYNKHWDTVHLYYHTIVRMCTRIKFWGKTVKLNELDKSCNIACSTQLLQSSNQLEKLQPISKKGFHHMIYFSVNKIINSIS